MAAIGFVGFGYYLQPRSSFHITAGHGLSGSSPEESPALASARLFQNGFAPREISVSPPVSRSFLSNGESGVQLGMRPSTNTETCHAEMERIIACFVSARKPPAACWTAGSGMNIRR